MIALPLEAQHRIPIDCKDINFYVGLQVDLCFREQMFDSKFDTI